MSDDVLIRKLWNRNEARYYEELESFHKTHMNATSILYDTESNVPIRAEYYFRPYALYVEHKKLMQKLLEQEILEEKEK